jgi:tetratricopeptide (TPR) repeat protein
MILKNEAHVIARALESLRPFVDCYAIVDTGSTDNTKTVANWALEGLEGAYVEAPWEGYGPSRTRSIRLAEEVGADYCLIADADDIWSGTKPELGGDDAYAVWCRRTEGSHRWTTTRLLKLGAGIRYDGMVHEQPVRADGKPPLPVDILEGLSLLSPPDGATWKDPGKYLEHAKMIARAMVDEPGNSRYAFYLAQSYRDHGDDERAARLYLARAGMGAGDHAEEVYCSYLEAGRALMRRGRMDDAKAALLKAHQSYPARREAMAELARVFALKAATSPPPGTLFVERMEFYQ